MGTRSQRLIQPIELLKNVYSLAASDSDWMGIVLRHCEGAFDSGEGVFGYLHARKTSVSTVEKQTTRIYGLLRLRCRGDLGSLFRYGERHRKPTSCSRARFE